MALLSNATNATKKGIYKKYSRVRCHFSLMSHRGRTSPLLRSTWTTLPGYRGL